MLLLLLSCLSTALTFNIDTKSSYVIKSGAEDYFGFSVALHKTDSESYLLVGAPIAQTAQPNIEQGGAVYKCKLDTDIGDPVDPIFCTEQLAALDEHGDKYTYPYSDFDYSYNKSGIYTIQKENKSHQWMGVSVQSSANSTYIVGCAHRYEDRYLINPEELDDPPRQLVGKCSVLDKNLQPLQEYIPCAGRDSGYTKYGYCQAGASTSLADRNIVLGLPGCYEGSGCVTMYDVEDFADGGTENEHAFDPTQAVDEHPELSYTGYSSVLCDMNGDGRLDLIAGGPRGDYYKGEVSIYEYDSDLKELMLIDDLWHKLTGEQFGSYYGHSLLCADFNGDGVDDLVVGAPWYTLYKGGVVMPDTGRIYAYTGLKYDYLAWDLELTTIDGTGADEAFGFSLTSAGDINTDGYNDMFVGSPYYNEGEGRVYLYLGSKTGIQTTPSQIISPTTLNVLDNLRGFGWSIDAGKDMDNNGFPDVLIGSYKSNHAVFLRTVRIIDVKAQINFLSDEIDPNSGNLETPSGEKVPGIELQVCYQYIGQVRGNGTVKIQFTLKLDTTQPIPRIYSNYTSPSREYSNFLTISTADNKMIVCTDAIPAYYVPELPGLAPIQVTMTANLEEVATFEQRAVLNQQLITDATRVVRIASDCPKETGVCQNDMSLVIQEVEYEGKELYPIVVGLVKDIKIPVTVTNNGPHTAYGSRVELSVPAVLNYVGSDVSAAKCNISTPVTERTPNYTLVCRLEDQFLAGTNQTRNIRFDISGIKHPTKLDIRAVVRVKEPSQEINESSSTTVFVLDIKNLADLVIRAGSAQQRLPFNNKYGLANKLLRYEGPTVRHIYEVSLREDSRNLFVEDISIVIYWPNYFPDGAWLFPLTDVIEVILPSGDNSTIFCKYKTHESELAVLLDGVFDSPKEFYEKVSCKDHPEQCTAIHCNIERLERGRTRLKINLFTQIQEYLLYDFQNITVESYAEIKSVREGMVLPKGVTASAKTILYASTSKSRNLLWILIGAILGGLFILAIIILVLLRFTKFFKRLKPEAEPPTQVGYKAVEDYGEYADELRM